MSEISADEMYEDRAARRDDSFVKRGNEGAKKTRITRTGTQTNGVRQATR